MATPSRTRIFISYRREDSDYPAARLADDLRKHFSEDQVFEDVSSIEPGTDFVDAVQHGLETCAAVLVVIGSKWLTIADRHGRRRLEEPGDWVAHEVAESLKQREVRVFPVLVDADMPSADELPPALKPLARRQAFVLTRRHWRQDVAALVAFLKRVPGLEEVSKGRSVAEREVPPAAAFAGRWQAELTIPDLGSPKYEIELRHTGEVEGVAHALAIKTPVKGRWVYDDRAEVLNLTFIADFGAVRPERIQIYTRRIEHAVIQGTDATGRAWTLTRIENKRAGDRSPDPKFQRWYESLRAQPDRASAEGVLRGVVVDKARSIEQIFSDDVLNNLDFDTLSRWLADEGFIRLE